MNTSQIISLLLAVALVALCIKLTFFGNKQSPAESSSVPSEQAYQNIMTRVSVRAYTDRQIEDDKIEKILRAAMAAPSAGNKQPWRFIVVKDKNILSTLSKNFKTMQMVEDAPMAFVVCGDMNSTFQGNGLDYWVEDASAATENLLLAAHSLGLGAVWCGVYPLPERVDFLKNIFKLPDNIVPLCVVPVGYPNEKPQVKDKWKPQYIHQNTWNDDPVGSLSSVEEESTQWQKIEPAKLMENPFTLFTNAMALTVGTSNNINSMTIGWGGLGILWGKDRPVATVYVEKSRYTHSLMENNEYFTITAFTDEYKKNLHYLGTVSGRDEDKIKGCGLTLMYTDSGNPAFKEGRLILECKKIYGAPFNPEGFGSIAKEVYANRQLHSIYIGEIIGVYVKNR